jgi:Protein of unknown function (DUF3617)
MKKIALAALTLVLALAVNTTADEFGATPGLWKTTLSRQHSGQAEAPLVQWHCVAEKASPWVAFAQLDVPPQVSCKRTNFVRNATSLRWRLVCSGQFAITNQGSITFGDPLHYTGTVTLSGTIMGYPISDTISVKGEHVAACTSPAD